MQYIISKCLSEISSKFLTDELAYLSLTSKIELPIRDRLAFDLHQKLVDDGFVVSREWKRTDLAILKNNKPQALIELKAMYTFDAALDTKNIGGFLSRVEGDILKAKALAVVDTEVYALLLATHPEDVDRCYTGIIKYDSGINKAIKRFGTEEQVKAVAESSIANCFSHHNVVASGEITGGSAFGCNSSVLYWLVKA